MDEYTKHLEDVLKRKLSNGEITFLRWIHGWDRETIDMHYKLMADMYEAGKSDRTQ